MNRGAVQSVVSVVGFVLAPLNIIVLEKALLN